MTTTDEILKQRGSVHGDASKQFAIARRLKQIFGEYLDQNVVNLGNMENLYMMRETLDMTAVKLSRIFSGVPDYQDHWDDIAGYNKIVANHIQKTNGAIKET